ncbi:SRPBCC family protein [Amycolatopsis albispora]|uniref:ATPase n=1 Tax=Amycolatopsis albispora TaxID=1804986 RepID=A0A344LHS3_9PSEU|nr:SRPBCC domain-containing protein [Amycolatopsis albispora]AXB47597.1 ATPase [Amycolatopsis albispora]
MPREFEINRQVTLPATPEQVWAAITAGTAGWMFPTESDPEAGGYRLLDDHQVLDWTPPERYALRAEQPDGSFNALEWVLEGRQGTTVLRFVHSGMLADEDWDNEYDGAAKHTDFYLHTLGQYVGHFPGRAATYVAADAPESSMAPDGFARLLAALGVREAGDRVEVALAGQPRTAVVDHLNQWFLGLRTEDALYRVFGRNTWGGPVGVSLHLFARDANAETSGKALRAWLDTVYR